MKVLSSLIIFIALTVHAHAQNVITVAPTGGDYTNPVEAVEAIGTTYPSANFHNRYLVKIMPGIYKVDETIKLKPFVSLAGSGRQATQIWGDVIGTGYNGVIAAASYSEISGLTVVNHNENSSNYVISARYITDSVLQDLTVMATGRVNETFNWKTGLWIEDSKHIRLTHISVKIEPLDGGTCVAATVRSSNLLVEDSEFTSDACGLAVAFSATDGSQVEIFNSRFVPTKTPVRTLNAVTVGGTETYPQTLVSIKNSTMVGRLISGFGADKLPSKVEISFSELDGETTGSTNPNCFSVHDGELNRLDRYCN